MDPSPRAITLVSPQRASLGHALRAALVSRGWSVTPIRSEVLRPDLQTRYIIVLLEDDHGNLDGHVPRLSALSRWICIGSVRSLHVLQRVQPQGAIVLNQAAPLLALLRHVEGLFADVAPPTTPPRLALHRRLHESHALTLLTAAEDAVLRGMLAGASATQMGLHAHLSIHTIRSHIKAVLAKLGVRSQLEAVAIAHRSGRMGWRADAMARFTNSGDDDSFRGDGTWSGQIPHSR